MITVADLTAEVDEVKAMMIANIEKVLDRGERLDDLEQRSEVLSNQAMMFQVIKHMCTHLL